MLRQLSEPVEPLYRIIARTIGERIAKQEYAPGEALPSEPELGREFGVSRITIRQALALFKQQGILSSRPGRGTLVRPIGRAPTGMRMTGTLNDLINYGAETQYTPVDRAIVTPPAAVALELDADASTPILRFRGLRSRPGEPPFGLEEVYIPESIGRRVDNTTLAGRTLFSVLEDINGIRIVDARQVITAVPAPQAASQRLHLRAREPVLKVTRSYQIVGGRTVEVAVSHYHPSKFEYVMTLYRA